MFWQCRIILITIDTIEGLHLGGWVDVLGFLELIFDVKIGLT